MSAPPPIIFEVTFTVAQELRWCMRAKGAFVDWMHSEAESAARPIAELPAADLAMHTDHCDLTLTWIELPADSAWHAMQRAAEIIEQVLPEILRTRALRAGAMMQNPDPDMRRPLDT